MPPGERVYGVTRFGGAGLRGGVFEFLLKGFVDELSEVSLNLDAPCFSKKESESCVLKVDGKVCSEFRFREIACHPAPSHTSLFEGLNKLFCVGLPVFIPPLSFFCLIGESR